MDKWQIFQKTNQPWTNLLEKLQISCIKNLVVFSLWKVDQEILSKFFFQLLTFHKKMNGNEVGLSRSTHGRRKSFSSMTRFVSVRYFFGFLKRARLTRTRKTRPPEIRMLIMSFMIGLRQFVEKKFHSFASVEKTKWVDPMVDGLTSKPGKDFRFSNVWLDLLSL